MSDDMHPAAKQAIDALYTRPDRDAILRACGQTPPVVHQMLAWLGGADYVKVTAYPERVDPSVDIWVDVQYWRDVEFVSEFASRIRVSRLAAVCHIAHRFSVSNRHPAPIAPSLDGFGDAPYIAPQRELHEHVGSRLQAAGYTELSLSDMDHPIVEMLGTPVHTSNNIPTVRLALFDDLLGVLEG